MNRRWIIALVVIAVVAVLFFGGHALLREIIALHHRGH